MAPFTPRLYDYEASGNCLKVRMAVRMLDLPYERVPVDIFGGDTLTDEFAAINPLRTTPVLEVAPKHYVNESNAILLLLAEGTRLLPAERLARAEVARWLFVERSFTPAVGGLRFLRLTGRDLDEREVSSLRASGNRMLGHVDEALTGRRFLAGGTPSVADLSIYAYAHVAGDAGFELGAYRALRRWIERVENLPGFVNDLVRYPPNAGRGLGRSIYD